MLAISVVVLALFFRAVTSQSTSTAAAPTTPPNVTATTAVPSPTASLASSLPSQDPLPSKQAWCPSEIFCPGAVRWFQSHGGICATHSTFHSCCKPWLLQMFTLMIKPLWTRSDYRMVACDHLVDRWLVANKQEFSSSTSRLPKYLLLDHLWQNRWFFRQRFHRGGSRIGSSRIGQLRLFTTFSQQRHSSPAQSLCTSCPYLLDSAHPRHQCIYPLWIQWSMWKFPDSSQSHFRRTWFVLWLLWLTQMSKLTMIIRWKVQRTILLGQFLDCWRPYSIPAVLYRECNSSKLYGRIGTIWFYP